MEVVAFSVPAGLAIIAAIAMRRALAENCAEVWDAWRRALPIARLGAYLRRSPAAENTADAEKALLDERGRIEETDDQTVGGREPVFGDVSSGSTAPRAELGEYAPRIKVMRIPTDKIREVIGMGGKTIREIVEKTGANVNIEDDGTVSIASGDPDSIVAAFDWIRSLVAGPEPGAVYEGKVVKVMESGAFVNFLGSRDGLVHVSELTPQRVAEATDVVRVGDTVKVRFLGTDDRGKVRLSMKAVDQTTGEDLSKKRIEAS